MINPRKQHRREQQLAKQKDDLHGEGSFLFQNNTSGDYQLPRPTKANVRHIPRGGQFVGDSYYMALVRSGDLKLIKELTEGQEVREVKQSFLFSNRTRDEVHLPVPSKNGQTVVSPGGTCVGDARFFPLLRTGQLTLVSEVKDNMEDKLITEVPPTVTNDGQVEYVKKDDTITEEKPKNKDKKNQLHEQPLDGVRLLLD